ncbi:MAG: hypothetical protein NT067_06225 [Candidatus Diapherotrites archaeon]|nr:hypothetical protein [Candidatus Diapherotrites archaeon]
MPAHKLTTFRGGLNESKRKKPPKPLGAGKKHKHKAKNLARMKGGGRESVDRGTAADYDALMRRNKGLPDRRAEATAWAAQARGEAARQGERQPGLSEVGLGRMRTTIEKARMGKADADFRREQAESWKKTTAQLSDPGLVEQYEKAVARWKGFSSHPGTINAQAFLSVFGQDFVLRERYMKFTETGKSSLADFKTWLSNQKPE